MNEYLITITSQFYEELDKIYYYIYSSLHSPKTANKLYFKIQKSLRSLNFFPERYPRISSPKLYPNHNLRKLIVDKYIIIYEVNTYTNQVFILHIFHGSQDYLNQL